MCKLLVVVPHMTNSIRVLADILRHLDRSIRISLLCLSDDPDDLRFRNEFPPDAPVEVLRAPAFKPLRVPFIISRIRKLAKEHDVVVCFAELTYTYWSAIAAGSCGKPVIGWVQAHLGQVFQLKQRPWWLHRPFMTLLYPRIHAVIGSSHLVGDNLRQQFGLRNVVDIQNGTDIERIKRLAAEPIPERLRSIFNKPTLLSISALTYQKHPQLLVHLQAKLRNERRLDNNLLIIGQGHMRDELEQLATELGVSDSVHFSGYVDNPYPMMSAATGFVLTSRWEGLPLVLAEAVSLGKPVIATDSPGGTREVLGDGKYGMLVPVDDLDAITQGAASVLTDASIRDRYAAQAAAGARQWDIRSRSRQLESVIESALARDTGVSPVRTAPNTGETPVPR